MSRMMCFCLVKFVKLGRFGSRGSAPDRQPLDRARQRKHHGALLGPAPAGRRPVVNDHEKSAVSIMEIPHPWVIEIGL
jgi:hypothetical protein